jgi:hypothetical protein
MSLEEAQGSWGKRSTTIRDKVADNLRRFPGLLEYTAAILRMLPVATKDAEEKRVLIKDLMDASRERNALDRRIETLANRLTRLPVVNPTVGKWLE